MSSEAFDIGDKSSVLFVSFVFNSLSNTLWSEKIFEIL